MSRTPAILSIHRFEMVKRICSLLTLLVLVLTECFTPMSYVLAEINAEQDFQIEENNIQEEEEEVSEDIEEEDIGDSLSDREEETQNDGNEEENIQEYSDNVLE
jgi:hypothetical protein